MNTHKILKLIKYLKLSLLIPFAFLLLLHFVIKDRGYYLAMLFNVTPIPILIGIGLIISLLLITEKKWLKVSVLTTLFLAIHWIFSYYGFANVPVSSDNNHILFWNIDNRKFIPRDVIKEKISTYNPEIIAFLETKNLSLNETEYLSEEFPQYSFKSLEGYFVIGIKGDIEFIEYTKLKTITRYNLLKVKINNQIKTILIVDIGVIRHYNRWQDLENILDYGLRNKVDLIVGDFNTPYESMHFKGFKNHYKSFHDVSEGFTATWPKGIPLLELDQIWVDQNIEAISLKKFFYKEFSNHDMLIGSFKFKNDAIKP